ncbi:neuronal acetylcholine receptor subunit alpha-6-like, partial [Strongylocentrotus purpuratus]|uniref:Neurotransmitter-gated ion-channel ligand-binding domain-containing protein n=1 Tax=Strongylocentrotus purpuratus TaxID=7668 RepID=A0A7M7P3A7_STRPU
TWHDYRARWDPMDYDNITDLSLGLSEIWTPKILLSNGSGHPQDTLRDATVGVSIRSTDLLADLLIPEYAEGLITLRAGASSVYGLEITSQWRPLELYGVVPEYVIGSRTYQLLGLKFTAERLPHYTLMNVALPSGAMTFISLWVFWLPQRVERK